MAKKISDEQFLDITKRLKELQTLYNLYRITSSTLNLNELLNLIMELTLNAVEAEVGLILLYNRQTGENYPKVTWGLTKDIIDGIIYKNKTKLIDWLNKKDKPVVIKNLDKHRDFKYIAKKNIFVKSLLYAPLSTKNRKIGAIIL
ncbi:MAG TPA: GAF domain-containing protein, partial [Candidatus Atribacteria bacterium]|nr:GAF domain-containing protein [Candidatus Atribacteria bacterium]